MLSFIDTEIAPRMRAENPAAGVKVEFLSRVPPMPRLPNSPAERLVRELTGANDTFTVAYTAEASQFQAAGVPAVICGPGNIAQAHQPDEWIDATQLDACSGFLDRLAAWSADGGTVG